MDSLKELTNFLKSKGSNGASFSDLKDVFQNEDEIKSFIKMGLENEVIIKTGAKRGTRYYSSTVTPNESKPQPTKEDKKNNKKEDSNYEPSCEKGGTLESYLQSDKPVVGIPVITETRYFGTTENLPKSLQSGMVVKQYYLEYDKKSKRNIIAQEIESVIYNRVSLKREGRLFVVEKFDTKSAQFTRVEFKSYEAMREYVRIEFRV